MNLFIDQKYKQKMILQIKKKKEIPISSKKIQEIPKRSLCQFSHPSIYTKHSTILNLNYNNYYS
jgi:hypothetical protein